MLTIKPVLPIRCLISADLWPDADPLPPDSPLCDGPLTGPLAIVTWPDDSRQLVQVVYEDAVLQEAKIRFWDQVPGQACAVAVEMFAPLVWLSERS
jgi:hypothetical protein